ncbi:hypothetical protein Scep_021593 [Stephania cephalantha]|uniref:Uncharacterized protein n=1 Tax=Stephania cephalantha TaxID=152367 RepID=A0AAP0F4M1_9MAGN
MMAENLGIEAKQQTGMLEDVLQAFQQTASAQDLKLQFDEELGNSPERESLKTRLQRKSEVVCGVKNSDSEDDDDDDSDCKVFVKKKGE